jgi:hypothetical protein
MSALAPAGPVTLNAGVISRARARRRRRVAWLAAAAVLGAASLGAGMFAGGGVPAPAHRVPPSALLAQSPDMGITCGVPGCDRIGLAVWLRWPARSVRATVAGRGVTLQARLAAAYQPGPAARRTMFVGYLRAPSVFTRARITLGPGDLWAPASSFLPTPRVQITVALRDGGSATTALPVPLQMGWG